MQIDQIKCQLIQSQIFQLDPRGYISPAAIRVLNRMQAMLPSRLAKYISDNSKLTEKLMERCHSLSPPFVLSAFYSCGYFWNEEDQVEETDRERYEEAFDSDDESSLGNVEDEKEGLERKEDRKRLKEAVTSHRVQKFLTFYEGDKIVVLDKAPQNDGKLTAEQSKMWYATIFNALRKFCNLFEWANFNFHCNHL